MKKTNFITRIDSGLKRGEPFEFYFDGEPITAYSGETVAQHCSPPVNGVWVQRIKTLHHEVITAEWVYAGDAWLL